MFKKINGAVVISKAFLSAVFLLKIVKIQKAIVSVALNKKKTVVYHYFYKGLIICCSRFNPKNQEPISFIIS